MKKVMIITVEMGIIALDIAHAICFSIRQQNPDYLIFLVILNPKL